MMMQQQHQAPRLSPVAAILITLSVLVASVAPSAASSAASSVASGHLASQQQQQQQLGERVANQRQCAQRLSCKATSSGGQHRQTPNSNTLGDPKNQHLCYCDEKCQLYQDCCVDSPHLRRAPAPASGRSISVRSASQQQQVPSRQQAWHCHRVNHIYGDVLVKASCVPDWHVLAGIELDEARKVEMRCDNTKRLDALAPDIQADPLGMMMPITDLDTGITYANTYCVRCNKFYARPNKTATAAAASLQQDASRRQAAGLSRLVGVSATRHPGSSLIFWSPLVECNYNRETDDKNTLIDLITNNTKSMLQYSAEKNRWIINEDHLALYSSSGSGSNSTTTTTTTTTTILAEAAVNGSLATTTCPPPVERTCTIIPKVPDSVDHLVRFCHSEAVQRCPPAPGPAPATASSVAMLPVSLNNISLGTIDRLLARHECEHGQQALVLGLKSGLVYRNPGCALCNNDNQLTCDLGRARAQAGGDLQGDKTPSGGAGELGAGEQDDSLSSLGRESGRTGDDSGGSVSATLSMLFDFDPYYGSGDSSQVGVKNFCPGKNQIFDVINRACRCIYCGLNQRVNEDGICIRMSQDEIETALIMYGQYQQGLSGASQQHLKQEQASNLDQQLASNSSRALSMTPVAPGDQLAQQQPAGDPAAPQMVNKFGPWMAYLTIVNLTISILCLSLYLVLYYLSMFNLNSLKVDLNNTSQVVSMVQRERGIGTTPRRSRVSSEATSLGGASYCSSTSSPSSPRSNSLSSRGVACLSGSLLAAYVLFLLGHNTVAPATAALAPTRQKPTMSCFLIAIGTYYCFLIAFSWMFLLSYDIWRILRLATCQLRGPAMHSQSTRFISYALFSLLASGLIVGLSVFVEEVPLMCQVEPNLNISLPSQHHARHNNHTRHPHLQSTPHALGGLSHNKSSTTTTTTTTALHIEQPAAGSNCSKLEQQFDDIVHLYRPNFGRRSGSCWFTNKRALLVFFGVPVMLILIFNLIFFLHSSFMVIGTLKYDPSSHSLSSLVSSVVRDYRLYCRLTTIMGLTWITGILASFGQNQVLWYLFIVLNTLQGLFIFIAFGCKRSKLSNVKILLTYVYFRWLLFWGKLDSKLDDAGSSNSSCCSIESNQQKAKPTARRQLQPQHQKQQQLPDKPR